MRLVVIVYCYLLSLTFYLLGLYTPSDTRKNVNLLLPGFQGYHLQARVLGWDGDKTTYAVNEVATRLNTSPITVVKAPYMAAVTHTNTDGIAASIICQVEGTTYASCHAKYKTLDVQGTLAAKDLNWMDVTVMGTAGPTTTPATDNPMIQSNSARRNYSSRSGFVWIANVLIPYLYFLYWYSLRSIMRIFI